MTVTFADELSENCPHDVIVEKYHAMTIDYFCLYCKKFIRQESRLRTMNC